MKSLFAPVGVIALVALMSPGSASAGLFSCAGLPATTLCWQPPIDGTTGQRDLGDLDHHMAYGWDIAGVNLTGKTITGATLSFSQIRNWDPSNNRLFAHLLDSSTITTAANAGGQSGTTEGVGSFTDDTSATPTTLKDNWDPANYSTANPGGGTATNTLRSTLQTGNTAIGNVISGNSGWFVGASGPGADFVGQPGMHSFGTVGEDYTYTFTAAQLTTLAAYIANGGDFAFGLDPDCHFLNEGVTFQLSYTSSAVPEPASILLLITVLAGVAFLARKSRRGQAEVRS